MAMYEDFSIERLSGAKCFCHILTCCRRVQEAWTSTTLAGDEADSHSRFLEAMIEGIRIVNIYLPNGGK